MCSIIGGVVKDNIVVLLVKKIGGIDNFSPFSNAVYFFNQKLKNVLF